MGPKTFIVMKRIVVSLAVMVDSVIITGVRRTFA